MNFKCSFKLSTANAESLYTCEVTDVTLLEPDTTINSITGTHLRFYSNNYVQAICFSSSVIDFFPQGLNKIFPYLKKLKLSECGLKIIGDLDLQGLECLEVLDLSKNYLTSLPLGTFTKMKKLKKVVLADNQLENLDPEVFKPILSHVEVIDLSRNREIDKVFYREHFGNLPNFKDIFEFYRKKPQKTTQQKFSEQLLEEVRSMWEIGLFSDFTIIGGLPGATEKYEVHKNIIGMQSEVFAAAVSQKDAETMTIDDFSADVVETLLNFLYTGKINDESVLLDLYSIAAWFEVRLLMDKTEKLIIESTEAENALEVFELGHLHYNEKMKLSAFEVVKKMFPDRTIPDSVLKKPEHFRSLVETYKLTNI